MRARREARREGRYDNDSDDEGGGRRRVLGGGRRERRKGGGGLISGIASGVGLLSESYKAHKEGKEEKQRNGDGYRQEMPYRQREEWRDGPGSGPRQDMNGYRQEMPYRQSEERRDGPGPGPGPRQDMNGYRQEMPYRQSEERRDGPGPGPGPRQDMNGYRQEIPYRQSEERRDGPGPGQGPRQDMNGYRQEIPYRQSEERRDGPGPGQGPRQDMNGPPPAYDAPGYSSGQSGYSQGQISGNREQRYPDEEQGGYDRPYGAEMTGSSQYQGERMGPGQYSDEKASQNPFRDDRSGPNEPASYNPYRNQMSSPGQCQGERSFQDERSSPNQYPDEKAGASRGLSSNPAPEDDAEDELEDDWALDEAQDELRSPIPENAEPPTGDHFLSHHPPPGYSNPAPRARLPFPVVIPQRRPKNRSRGFIRAYAPVLENCGIDQASWLEFLDSFEKNSTANPWIKTVNFAALATIPLPMVIGSAVGYAIRKGTEVAIETQGRERTNRFLAKINDEFFRPRGLFCLIMTWNPASSDHVEAVNLDATIASRTQPASMTSKLRQSDGVTHGEWQFPETAPLVFPALDKLASQTGEDAEKKQGKMARSMDFVAGYWDRRATAEYVSQNPNSMLANVPQAKFASRYSDPNHPASSGLIGLVTGGKLSSGNGSRGLIGGLASAAKSYNQKPDSQQAQSGIQGYGNQGNQEDNPYSRNYKGRKGRRRERRDRSPREKKGGMLTGNLKMYLSQNVMYMLVVNMPTEEEMANAKRADEASHSSSFAHRF